MSLELERFSPAMDGASLGRLWRDFCIEGGFAHPDVSAWLQSLADAHNAGILIGVAAWDGTKMVGFIEGLAVYEPATGATEAVVRSLYVVPTSRGTGVAARLAHAFSEQVRERGVVAVTVSGVVGPRLLERVLPGAKQTDTLWRSEV